MSDAKAPADPAGLATAVATVGPGEPPRDTAEQLPLLPLPAVADPARGAAATPDRQPGRAGRPPGARNKRTEDWVEYLSQHYRSPLILLAETISRPVEQLAKELGIEKAAAFRMQLEAADKLAPYLHQKLPQAIDVNGEGIVGVNLVIGADALPAGFVAAGPLEARILENEQNQGASEPAPAPVGQSGVGR